jgi:DNA end-binding protein Ku
VRKPDEVPHPRIRDAEIEMATTLIENLAADWDPARYHDRYRNELLDLLRAKAEGEALPEPSAGSGGEVVDLMEALRQSVEASGKRRAGAKPKPAARNRRKAS